MAPIYAAYKGDCFIDLGTIPYLALVLGVKQESIRFYMSPVYQRRCKGNRNLIIIRIEDD